LNLIGAPPPSLSAFRFIVSIEIDGDNTVEQLPDIGVYYFLLPYTQGFVLRRLRRCRARFVTAIERPAVHRRTEQINLRKRESSASINRLLASDPLHTSTGAVYMCFHFIYVCTNPTSR